MLRRLLKLPQSINSYTVFIQKCSFLTDDYKCTDVWNSQTSSTLLNKINHSDFYNLVVQNYSYKGVISAIDVDIFANSIKDSTYLEELKDLLHKLRLSADTGNTLASTHHAVIRNYMEHGDIHDVIEILKDPLNFGVFLDDIAANMLLDKLIKSEKYDQAVNVASFIMLQEEYTNIITNTLCQYACYKYIMTKDTSQKVVDPTPSQTKQKVEEIKIRVKYLRNPYFDDHFDIKDTDLLAGKTLAWISEKTLDKLNYNLQIVGWLMYKKYDKLLSLFKHLINVSSFEISNEVMNCLEKQCELESEEKEALHKCVLAAHNLNPMEYSIESSLKISIENAINRQQTKDISFQHELFKSWAEIREQKLEEQTKRLDRAKRLQLIQERQTEMASEEQKLWFFETEEKIDLLIEEKEQLEDKTSGQKIAVDKLDENYIPPEIRPRRK